jgi:hypothetical protein
MTKLAANPIVEGSGTTTEKLPVPSVWNHHVAFKRHA